MADYRVISSDSHVIEPADLWANRIGRKFKDRAPEIVTLEEGDWWFCDGRKVVASELAPRPGCGLSTRKTFAREPVSKTSVLGDTFLKNT